MQVRKSTLYYNIRHLQ